MSHVSKILRRALPPLLLVVGLAGLGSGCGGGDQAIYIAKFEVPSMEIALGVEHLLKVYLSEAPNAKTGKVVVDAAIEKEYAGALDLPASLTFEVGEASKLMTVKAKQVTNGHLVIVTFTLRNKPEIVQTWMVKVVEPI